MRAISVIITEIIAIAMDKLYKVSVGMDKKSCKLFPLYLPKIMKKHFKTVNCFLIMRINLKRKNF